MQDLHECLFEFFGISTLLGYFIPNHVYTCTLSIYDLLTNFIGNIFTNLSARAGYDTRSFLSEV